MSTHAHSGGTEAHPTGCASGASTPTTSTHPTECPECGAAVGFYTVGAPGIGAGWACFACPWSQPTTPTRILQPWEVM